MNTTIENLDDAIVIAESYLKTIKNQNTHLVISNLLQAINDYRSDH